MGATFACFQSVGTIPVFNEDWYRRVKAGANSCASSFRRRGLILSGPGDLEGSSFFNRENTPSSLMGMVFRVAEEVGGKGERPVFLSKSAALQAVTGLKAD